MARTVPKKFNQFFTEDMLMTFFFSWNRLNTSFLDIEASHEKRKFLTTVYRKPTFSGFYTHFEKFLSTIYKFGMISTLACHCFKTCSDWVKFHEELSFLKKEFLKNEHLLSFVDNCFKTFLDKLFIKRPQLITVEKKTMILSLSYIVGLS